MHPVEERDGGLYVTLAVEGEVESDKYAHNADIGNRQQPLAVKGIHSKLVGNRVGAPPSCAPWTHPSTHMATHTDTRVPRLPLAYLAIPATAPAAGGDGCAPQR